jgi:glycosyltransferase involved in cell wall biosynthesis
VSRLRLAIDASPLLLRSAGVKNYLYYLIRHLAGLPGSHQLHLFPFLRDVNRLNHEASATGRAATLGRLALLRFLNIENNPLINSLYGRYDLFHTTSQVRNPPFRTRVTATLFDLTCQLMPEVHTPANVAADRQFAQRVLRRATALLAISESTRQDAIRLLDLDPDRIRVVYPGVPRAYFEVPPERSAEVRRRYALDRPYLLALGTIEPRKNLALLLDAYSGLDPDLRRGHQLVLAGPVGWRSEAVVARLREPGRDWRHLGYVAEDDLPGLTAGAAALVYPSLYEGFGFPVAQAMAAGVPVLTSNVSSLPEVAGEAAIYADPRSVAEVRAGLERLLTGPDLRRRLAAAGRTRASRYGWDASARDTLAFFEWAAGL